MNPDIFERMRLFIGERTALDAEVIDAVLAASREFWDRYPAAQAAAARLAQDVDEHGG